MNKPNNASRRALMEQRVQALEPGLERMVELSSRLSWVRIGVFAAGLAAAAGGFLMQNGRFFWVSILVFAGVFAAVVRVHRRLDRSIARRAAWLDVKRQQIARSALDWDGIPASGFAQRSLGHPFDGDLDIVGPRSLHRLADTAVSQEGSARLLQWLTETAPRLEYVMGRQPIARELAPRSLLRDRLTVAAVLAAGDGGRLRASDLTAWLEKHDEGASHGRWLLPLTLLALGNITLVALAALGQAPPLWRVTLPLYVMVYAAAARGIGEPFHEAMELQDLLRRLHSSFGVLERYGYVGAPCLKELCAPFVDPESRPSEHIRRLSRVVAAAGVRGNPMMWALVNLVLPWDLFCVVLLELRKEELAELAPAWLEAWYDVEALSSLANLAYLNPEYVFPEVRELSSDDQSPLIEASALGHPLIPADEKVGNDIEIEHLGQICLITGSNMAGKSTFVKAVGMNLVLAYAGGAVSASAMNTILFRMYTSIRITDSVTDGISYFYAEVKRLRALLEALEAEDELPLLFLVDEVFRGTNNRERLIGSRSLIRALADGRGAGLIATHDLELVALADEIAGLRNSHFRDDVADGRMTFDYKLRPGPCPTTNALRIMRMEGLPG
ncbi:MAG: MutS family DNA mismatch repair protein [Anaerolineae bacterium]